MHMIMLGASPSFAAEASLLGEPGGLAPLAVQSSGR